ncbi:MAG: DUF6677 family protein [Phycisphaerae bacterium]
MTDPRTLSRSPMAALVLGWLLPGAGHAYAGQRGKAVLFASLIVGLLIAGFALGGGTNILPNEWWYAPQLGVGGPTAALTPLSQYLAIRSPIDWASPLREIGTLYTAVAGLLNLLVMMDAYVTVAYPEERGDRAAHRAHPSDGKEGA